MEDVPNLVKSEDFKDIEKILCVILMSLPSNFGEFINWVAEVRRREDGIQSLSREEKGRLAVKVFQSFNITLFFPFLLISVTPILQSRTLSSKVSNVFLPGRSAKTSAGIWPF